MFGTKMDPIPYIVAAYGIGIVLILVYGAWQWKQRKKLRALERALHQGESL